MKKLIASLSVIAFLLLASSCGNGSEGTDTVDSLDTSPIDTTMPTDTVYPKTDTNSFRKDTVQPKNQ